MSLQKQLTSEFYLQGFQILELLDMKYKVKVFKLFE